MIRVGLARTQASYSGVEPPFLPDRLYPEFADRPPLPSGTRANPVYAAVRGALAALGLDRSRFESPEWNPLRSLAPAGSKVVLKPNFIRHWNPNEDGSVESVITHGSILRAVADYAALAVGPEGSVVVAEAPQQDCDFEEIRRLTGLAEIQGSFEAMWGGPLEVIDLRREWVSFRDGVIVSRSPLPGDPAGYRKVDLGERSFFRDIGIDPARFRGADYDPGPTSEHHRGGTNAYLLSETALSSDLIINLPKLKTHKKTGVTLSLKNLVGLNGDKNWLPHHSVGSPREGGDEYPVATPLAVMRSRATEWLRPLLARGVGTAVVRAGRRLERGARSRPFIRSGNWFGNRTTWRMCCDLNRCLAYSDRNGLHLDAAAPVRTTLHVIDGIVAGDGDGPLAPRDLPLGVVVASTDAVGADLVATRLMGFDEAKIPVLREPMADEPGPRITEIRHPDDVEVFQVSPESPEPSRVPLSALERDPAFEPHFGWKGHIEADPAPIGSS